MSDNIVERLREGCGCNFPETTCMAESECADAFAAADEIDRLTAENEKLRAALEQIAGYRMKGKSDADIARAALSASQPAPPPVRTDSRYNNAERIFGDD